MSTKKIAIALLSIMAVMILIAGCAPQAAPADEKPYIPVISKGFQHQFWQAVKYMQRGKFKDRQS